MHQTNCWCGVRAYANCTRCKAGTCRSHDENLVSPPSYLRPTSFGVGKSLEDAARYMGYWLTPTETYVCDKCRRLDGERALRQAIEHSRGWPSDLFGRALASARAGLIHEDMKLPFWDVVQSWISLGVPDQTFVTKYMTRDDIPSGRFLWFNLSAMPAEFTDREVRGWQFSSGTVLQNGEVLLNGRPIKPPKTGDSVRLIVDMSRLLFTSRGLNWVGPPVGWMINRSSVPRYLPGRFEI